MLRDKDYELAVTLGVIDEDTKNKCQYVKEDCQCNYEDHKYELEIAKLKDTIICLSKELLDNFYEIDFKIFYCPNYINDQLFIDRGLESNLSQIIYIPHIGE